MSFINKILVLLFLCLALIAKTQTINNGFTVLGNVPIDSRMSVSLLGDTSSVVWTYPGLWTYIQANDEYWYYDGTKWKKFQLVGLSNFYATGDTLYAVTPDSTYSVYLGGYLDNDTIYQTLTYNGLGDLSISDGNTVDLSDLLDNTDNQILSISNDTLYLVNGGAIYLGGYLDNDTVNIYTNDGILTENRTLDAAGNKLIFKDFFFEPGGNLAGYTESFAFGNSNIPIMHPTTLISMQPNFDTTSSVIGQIYRADSGFLGFDTYMGMILDSVNTATMQVPSMGFNTWVDLGGKDLVGSAVHINPFGYYSWFRDPSNFINKGTIINQGGVPEMASEILELNGSPDDSLGIKLRVRPDSLTILTSSNFTGGEFVYTSGLTLLNNKDLYLRGYNSSKSTESFNRFLGVNGQGKVVQVDTANFRNGLFTASNSGNLIPSGMIANITDSLVFRDNSGTNSTSYLLNLERNGVFPAGDHFFLRLSSDQDQAQLPGLGSFVRWLTLEDGGEKKFDMISIGEQLNLSHYVNGAITSGIVFTENGVVNISADSSLFLIGSDINFRTLPITSQDSVMLLGPRVTTGADSRAYKWAVKDLAVTNPLGGENTLQSSLDSIYANIAAIPGGHDAVTLNTTSYDYLSLSGQQIILGAIDASTDISNAGSLPVTNPVIGTNTLQASLDSLYNNLGSAADGNGIFTASNSGSTVPTGMNVLLTDSISFERTQTGIAQPILNLKGRTTTLGQGTAISIDGDPDADDILAGQFNLLKYRWQNSDVLTIAQLTDNIQFITNPGYSFSFLGADFITFEASEYLQFGSSIDSIKILSNISYDPTVDSILAITASNKVTKVGLNDIGLNGLFTAANDGGVIPTGMNATITDTLKFGATNIPNNRPMLILETGGANFDTPYAVEYSLDPNSTAGFGVGTYKIKWRNTDKVFQTYSASQYFGTYGSAGVNYGLEFFDEIIIAPVDILSLGYGAGGDQLKIDMMLGYNAGADSVLSIHPTTHRVHTIAVSDLGDGNGIISALPLGNVNINASGNDFVITNLGDIAFSNNSSSTILYTDPVSSDQYAMTTAFQGAQLTALKDLTGVITSITVDTSGINMTASSGDLNLRLANLTRTTQDSILYIDSNDRIYKGPASGAGSGVTQLADLNDVISATNTNRFVLVANGTTGYVGRALTEADISDLSHTVNTDNQNLSFTGSTGTINISGGTGTTIGNFGTTNTNYGFVIGSNNVTGAYLNSDGTWDDLDTDISANSDVAANTSARHNAVTLGAGNSTALTLSTQQLTLSDATLKINLSVDDLITLTGVAEGSVNLGTFTGTTITDNQTIKAALQELETAVEGASGADNLGNHTATQNIILGSNWLSGDGGNEGIQVSSTGRVGVGTTPVSNRALVVRNYNTTDIPFEVRDSTGNTLLSQNRRGELAVTGQSITNWNLQVNSGTSPLTGYFTATSPIVRIADSDNSTFLGFSVSNTNMTIDANGGTGLNFITGGVTTLISRPNYLDGRVPFTFANISANPAGLPEGSVFYDTDDDQLKLYTGAGWVLIGNDNLGTHTATQDLEIGTNDINIDGGALVIQDSTGAYPTKTFVINRAVGATAGDWIEIGNITFGGNNGGVIEFDIGTSNSGFAASARFVISTQYNNSLQSGGANVWLECIPINGVLAYSNFTEWITIDVKTNTSTNSFRIRRKVTGSFVSDETIKITMTGEGAAFTPAGATGTGGTVSGYYHSTVVSQLQNRLGINTPKPDYNLDVDGTLGVTGTVRFEGYGVGNKEVGDLALTNSGYIATYSTNGTLMELGFTNPFGGEASITGVLDSLYANLGTVSVIGEDGSSSQISPSTLKVITGETLGSDFAINARTSGDSLILRFFPAGLSAMPGATADVANDELIVIDVSESPDKPKRLSIQNMLGGSTATSTPSNAATVDFDANGTMGGKMKINMTNVTSGITMTFSNFVDGGDYLLYFTNVSGTDTVTLPSNCYYLQGDGTTVSSVDLTQNDYFYITTDGTNYYFQ